MIDPKIIDETLKEILHYHTGKPIRSIIPSATFEDLEIDSLDCVEITMDIEDKFGILIMYEELDNFKCLGDIWALVNKKIMPAPKDKPNE
jgi:acyl carrier protein